MGHGRVLSFLCGEGLCAWSPRAVSGTVRIVRLLQRSRLTSLNDSFIVWGLITQASPRAGAWWRAGVTAAGTGPGAEAGR